MPIVEEHSSIGEVKNIAVRSVVMPRATAIIMLERGLNGKVAFREEQLGQDTSYWFV